jgi:hypothetical protein
MVKHTSCFPICMVLLALVCFSISALADNVDLAATQPDFAVSTSVPGLQGNMGLFPLGLPENALLAKRGNNINISPVEILWLNYYYGGNYPDFGKSRGGGDFYWIKHASALPEPSSLTLLGTAVLAIAFSFRKRLQR